LLIDPLSPEKIDLSQEASRPETRVYSNIELWFGWQYTDAPGRKGVCRMGDQWSYEERRFSLLTSDTNGISYISNVAVQATHADPDGVEVPSVFRDELVVSGTPFGLPIGTALDATWSYWVGNRRGPLDLNASFTDGSVTRYGRVVAGNKPEDEPRTFRVPWNAGDTGQSPQWGRYVPTQ